MLKPELRQNFTIDATVLTDVAEALRIESGDKIIEIGAGKGVLSNKILTQFKNYTESSLSISPSKLLSYEVDEDLLEDLESIKYHNKDTYDFRIQNFLDAKPRSGYSKCTGNIPYHISETLFLKFIEWDFDFIAMITGIKFARKITGEFPGKISTIATHLFDSTIVKEYDKNIFYPKSKVDSGLIVMKRKRDISSDSEKKITHIFSNLNKKHIWLNKYLAFEQSQKGQIYHMDLDLLVKEIKSR